MAAAVNPVGTIDLLAISEVIMKLPDVFKFRFDPKKSDMEVLQHRIGFILWSCIKSGHIPDQYFNDKVLYVAKRIEQEKIDTYPVFKKLIKASKLSKFGMICIEESMFRTHYEMDHKFWSTIWLYIVGRKRQHIEIEADC